MELKALRYDAAGGVALVTLDRPERLNAWTARMEVEYRHALGRAEDDPAVRVIIITGAGRGFCAGADTDALEGLAASGVYGDGGREPVPLPGSARADFARADFAHAFAFPLGLSKPVIAAVNGPAAGVGFVLMCFADIRFAAAGAKLTTSFARLGLPAEHGVSWVLPRIVGAARAADLLFSARVVLAEEAAEMGLVNKVLPADELLPFAMDYARRIAEETSPSSIAVMKRQLWLDQLGSLDEAASDAEALLHQMITEPDFAEGVAALRQKRPPHFR